MLHFIGWQHNDNETVKMSGGLRVKVCFCKNCLPSNELAYLDLSYFHEFVRFVRFSQNFSRNYFLPFEY